MSKRLSLRHRSLASIFSGALIASATPVGAYEASTAERTCKFIPFGGSTEEVNVWICVYDRPGIQATNGDMIILVRNTDNRTKDVAISCQSQFQSSMQFTPKLASSGRVQLRISQEKPTDFYIIEANLSVFDRKNWSLASLDSCQWSVEATDKEPTQQWEVYVDVLKAASPHDSPDVQFDGW